MKKLSFLFALLCASAMLFADDVTIISFVEGIGQFTYEGTVEDGYTGQKYDNNSVTPTNTITFLNSYSSTKDEVTTYNYVQIAPAEGGFKAGDVVTLSAYYNNDEDKNGVKHGRLAFYNPEDEQIFMSELLMNGRLEEGVPSTQTFTLTDDAEYLRIARANPSGENPTRVNLLTLEVTRTSDEMPAEDVIIYKKVAENSETGLTGTVSRGGFIVDGDKVLVTSFVDGKLYQFAASDLTSLGQTEDSIQGNAYYMDMDDAGNYVFFEWTVGSATKDGAYVYNKTTQEIKYYELPIEARADQPSCVGNLVSGKGAILLSSNGLTYVNRYNFVDGEMVNIDQIEIGVSGMSGINTVSALDMDHFYVQLRSTAQVYVDATDVNSPIAKTIFSGLTYTAAHGAEVFQLAGRTYMAVGNYTKGGYLGAFEIFDVTDPENVFSVFEETENVGTANMGTSAVEFRVVVEGKRAYIYEFAAFNLRKYDMHIAEEGVITIEPINAPDELRLKNGKVEGNLRFRVTTNDAMESFDLALNLNNETIAAEDYTFEDTELVVHYLFNEAGEYTYVIGAQGVDELGKDQETELTYVLVVKEALPAMTIAEAIQAGEGAEVMLGEVHITFNPFNGKELFIADETGALEVFASESDFEVEDKDLYYAGSVYKGLQGTMSLYNNGVWELVPSVKANELEWVNDVDVVATAYTTKSADFTNHLVAMNDVVVEIRQEGDYTNIYAKFADNTEVMVYDKWGLFTVENNHKYNLVGVMTLFKNEPELYITEGEDLGEVEGSGVENINAKAAAQKVVVDGQVYILRNGMRYNVLGANVE